MKFHERNVVGAPVRVLVVESEDDAGLFRAWVDERASSDRHGDNRVERPG